MELKTRLSSPLSLVFFLMTFGPIAVRGNAIASWWVDTDDQYAPQIFQYNKTTSKIYSSLCNSLTAPIFAQNESTALDMAISPIEGTSIASLGYLSESTLRANVFYLANLEGTGTTVASAGYACNTTTGRWDPSAPSTGGAYNQYVSNGTNCATTAPSIDPAGGLSALYLDDDDGMRVFFKTAEYQTHYLQYQSSGDCTGWSYVGIASNLTTGHEVTSSFRASNTKVWTIAQTVFVNESAEADTEGEIEISTSNAGGTYNLWSINRMPTQIIANHTSEDTLEGIQTNMSTTSDSDYTYQFTRSWGFTFSAFNGATSKIGLADDISGFPSVFYIGTDGYLRRFSADSLGHWHSNSSQDTTKWPIADVSSSAVGPDFGIAYDTTTNRIWMHYVSNNAMVQVYQSAAGNWESATTLATYNATNLYWKSTSSSSDNNDSSSSSGESSDSTGVSGIQSYTSNLSTTNKTALGVGLGLGIPLLCAIIGGLWFFLRRRRNSRGSGYALPAGSKESAEEQHRPGTQPGEFMAPQSQGYWQDGVWIEKTATNYYASGGPGSQGAQRARQLGELPASGAPMYEMPAMEQVGLHEMPSTTAYR